ncbi:MAG: hypothetical protein ABI402_19620 [Ferruginibacter sp.]
MASKLKITTKYDEQLCNFHDFSMRPFLLPHIGKLVNFDSVLFIMESHYINPDFFEHQYDKENLNIKSPELFYNVKEEGLTEKFKEYLNTRQIIKDSESSDKTLAKGKSVYRKLSSVIRTGHRLKDNIVDSPLDYVGIYNYFQRPSFKQAASINVCEKDIIVAYDALNHILKIVNFQKIIFTSAKAYDCFIKIDNLNNKDIQHNRKIFRGTHPRVWGNVCAYENGITWKQWVINRLGM